ncbi:MAG: carboxypeptidase regulatory-like domain-containing protein [Chitinophagaceae bacterium]|nr:carboxypeptidase regulatory-like domain-containing protein [Chitinophagaceae bacterium]
MSKLSAMLLAVLFFSFNTQAQTISVSGAVEDTIHQKGVPNAVVSLLSAKDSVLYKFARTDVNGKYNIVNLKAGDYIVMTTHPYFADVLFTLALKDAETAIPRIALTSKSKLLEEVIVKPELR